MDELKQCVVDAIKAQCVNSINGEGVILDRLKELRRMLLAVDKVIYHETLRRERDERGERIFQWKGVRENEMGRGR